MNKNVMTNVLDKMKGELDEKQYQMLESVMLSEVLEEQSRRTKEIENLLECFVRQKSFEGCSSGTIYGYSNMLRKFLTEIEKDAKEVTKDDIVEYLGEYMNTHKIRETSVNGIRRCLSSFYDWMVNEDIIEKNPVKATRAVKEPETLKQPITEMDMELMRDTIDNVRDRAIFEVLDSTGARVSELCNMNRADVKTDTIVVYGKGKKERRVYLTPRARYWLNKYLKTREDDNPALFINYRRTKHSGIGRISVATVEKILRNLGRKDGILKVHPHRFRRTMASRAINKGMPIQEIQKLLGHTKISTTMIYCDVADDNVKLSHGKYV